jgi:hypothetical protein
MDIKTIRWKKKSFQQMVMGLLESQLQMNKFGPLLHTVYKKLNQNGPENLNIEVTP